jgi:ribosomal-protein-alanine N-acetyltransferase
MITTERLRLEMPGPEAAAAILAHHRENREHLAPWEPDIGDDRDNVAFWEERLARSLRERDEGVSLRLFVYTKDDGRMVGVCNFTRFVRGPLLSCLVGYHIDRNEQGKGFATEALRAACDHVITKMGITRIEATHDAENARSGRVLAKAGFVVEGFAKGFLATRGQWRDHVLMALVRR